MLYWTHAPGKRIGLLRRFGRMPGRRARIRAAILQRHGRLEKTSFMMWIFLAGLITAGLLIILFVLLTDGRYFGKRLMFWVYDRIGPALFSSRSDARQWRALVESLGLQGDESVLDVGTATGDLPLTIASMPDYRGEVVGVDWSPRMIQQAREEARRRGLGDSVRFEVVDVRKGLPFGVGEFDVITCLGLLETLPGQESVLQEFRRVLKKDGVMVLSLYRRWASRGVALSLEWYEKRLRALGADEITVVPCRGHHDAVVVRFTQQDRVGH